jgi:CheY-like chemotaxis protein
VLVVDDNHDQCTVLGELFASCGWDTRCVASCNAACTAHREFEAHVALIEPRLPDMAGWGLPDLFRQLPGVRMPVCIALAGHISDAELARAASRGFVSCLLKPMDFDELLIEIERAVAADHPRT